MFEGHLVPLQEALERDLLTGKEWSGGGGGDWAASSL